MSVNAFKGALRNKVFNSWLKDERAARSTEGYEYSIDNVNILLDATKEYREGEEAASKNSFIITKDTVRELLIIFKSDSFKNDKELEKLVNTMFRRFAKNTKAKKLKRQTIKLDGKSAVYFPIISFTGITELVNGILKLEPNELAQYYEKGHVIGLATKLLEDTINRIQTLTLGAASNDAKNIIITRLNTIAQYYKRIDAASANLKGNTTTVLAKYEKIINKNSAKYLVELQLVVENQNAAKEVRKSLPVVRELFSQGDLAIQDINDLLGKLKTISSDKTFINDLVTMQSSPSMIKLIENALIDTLMGKAVQEKRYVGNNILIGTKIATKPDTSAIRKEAKKKIAEIESLKAKLSKKPAQLRTTTGQFYGLVPLQRLLDASLIQRVKDNMGTGSRRDILNLRTGRFAESVKVERLSQSREGMITAFYSYMKNPYATFSQGGRQEFPASRDPKLLIAKSIREIGATMVGNRMRAVLV